MAHAGPKDFVSNVGRAVSDRQLRTNLLRATGHTLEARRKVVGEVAAWESWRNEASTIKDEVLGRLGEYLTEFETKATGNGIKVLWAKNAESACTQVYDIIRSKSPGTIVKSKSMVTEEISLNAFLEARGCEVVETDLGEYIVQLNHEPPSHITAPALHLSRQQIGELFSKNLGIPYTDDPPALTAAARSTLRQKFLQARIGITGANFLISETGSIVVIENEGNARFVSTLPRTHIVITGIEKVLPRMEDLPLFLRMLPRSATGQRITSYVSVIQSPRKKDDADGPEEIFVVLVDNNRSAILRDPELRPMLKCIRCGACLNTCPVYQTIGGHAYGSVYPGPIGSILTPSMTGLHDAKALPFASSLCGRCSEICPVKIPIHRLLLHQRAAIVGKGLTPWLERIIVAGWKTAMSSRYAYGLATAGAKLYKSVMGRGESMKVPIWSKTRDFPVPAVKSFRRLWREEEGKNARTR